MSPLHTNTSICLLLKNDGVRDHGGVVARLQVAPMPTRGGDQPTESALQVRLVDQNGQAPIDLLKSKSHKLAALAAYGLLSRCCRLPAKLEAKMSVQLDSKTAATVEGASGGLSMALALAEHLICERASGYGYASNSFGWVGATGTIDAEGKVGAVEFVAEKIRGYCQHIATLRMAGENIGTFYVFYPKESESQVSASLGDAVRRAGGQLLGVGQLQEALEALGVTLPTRATDIGLESYTRQDRWRFLGRRKDEIKIKTRLKKLWEQNRASVTNSPSPMLFWLEGRSGSGKTSLLQAGLLAYFEHPASTNDFNTGLEGINRFWVPEHPLRPAVSEGQLLHYLARQICRYEPLENLDPDQLHQLLSNTPTDAYTAIETALAKYQNSAQHPVIVLVIDQWEESFQGAISADERQRFDQALQALTSPQNSRVWVIGGIRSDYHQALADAGFGELLNQENHHYLLANPTEDELEEIVRGSAGQQEVASYRFKDPDLPGSIAEQARALEGQLGPLSLALSKLKAMAAARTTEPNVITREDYKSIGELAGVIAKHADENFYNALKDNQRATFDQLLQHFIGVMSQSDKAFARTVRREDLPQTKKAQEILEKLLQARLVSEVDFEKQQSRLRLVHEALLNDWPVLKNWQEREKKRLSRKRINLGVSIIIVLLIATFLTAVQWNRAEDNLKVAIHEKNNALTTQSRFLLDLARQENKRGFFDKALLLALHAYPGKYGGNRPVVEGEPSLAEAYLSANKRAVLPHQASVASAKFSPDGQTVVTASDDGTASLWSVATGRKLHTFVHENRVWSAGFSPDGQMVVTASHDRTAALWSVATGQKLHTFGHEYKVYSASLSPDGQWVVTASMDNTAALWSVATGQKLHTFTHEDIVQLASFSPDGQWVVTASDDGTASLWSVATGRKLRAFVHEYKVYSASFSPDGQWVVTASDDRTAALWSVATGQKLHTFGHEYKVYSASFSPDGQWVVTASMDNTAALWSVATGQKLHTFTHEESVRSAEFSPDGQTVITASGDNTAALWSVATGLKLHTFRHELNEDRVQSARLSPDGQTVVTVASDNFATLWSVPTGQNQQTFRHEDSVRSAEFSPDGQKVVTASIDGTAALWSVATGQKLHTFMHEDSVFSAGFSPDGQTVVTASMDITVVLWSVATGLKLHTFEGDSFFNSAEFSPDGQTLVAVLDNFSAALWSVATGQRLHTFTHEDRVQLASFSPDGQWVVTASDDGTAALWSVATGQRLHTFTHEDRVFSAGFSPDGLTVVTASSDGSAVLWSVATGRKQHTFTHEDRVFSAGFSPDGQTVVTASSDGSAVLWSVATGKKLHTFTHENSVLLASFSPDGQTVATLSRDKTAGLWSNTAVLWSVATGQKLQTFRDDDAVRSARFSPDGTMLLLGAGYSAFLSAIVPHDLTELVALSISALPKNRTCLTPDERKAYFLPELTNDEWIAQGCPQFQTKPASIAADNAAAVNK